MALLMKFLKEWAGHSPENSTYAYVGETQAAILIRDGIAEAAIEGREPQIPFNYRHVGTTRGRR